MIMLPVVSLALTLLLFLALAAAFRLPATGIFKPLVSDHPSMPVMGVCAMLFALLLVPWYLLRTLDRRGWIGWPHLTMLLVLVAGAFTWLAWDEPAVRRPLTMDELAPALPGDAASFAVVMRYAKGTKAAKDFRTPALLMAAVGPRQAEKYIDWLRQHRGQIEQQWAELAPLRAWWDEMAALPRLGDLTPPRLDASIPAFAPLRAYSQHAGAIAALQALDGRGDESAATIAKLYDVSRKLQLTSRTLVRSMIAIVIERTAVEHAGFLLDHATLSPAARTLLADTFGTGTGGAAGVRRLMLIEYAYFKPMLFTQFGKNAEADERLPLLARLVVNPIATQNLIGERYYQLAALAEARKFGQLEASKSEINPVPGRAYHMKNLLGRFYADLAMPALSKIAKSFWELEDARVALVARLRSS